MKMDVGMKVVCICTDWSDWIPDSSMLEEMKNPNFPADPVLGHVYTIDRISFDDKNMMCLNLKEIPDQQAPGGRHSFRYHANGFKPLEEVHNDMFREMTTPSALTKARPFILAIDAVQAAGHRVGKLTPR